MLHAWSFIITLNPTQPASRRIAMWTTCRALQRRSEPLHKALRLFGVSLTFLTCRLTLPKLVCGQCSLRNAPSLRLLDFRFSNPLGVISYGKTVRNALLVRRCKDLEPVFAKLRRSPAPLAQKLAALPRKLWSRALHGISGCPLAESQLASLRAAAVRTLHVNAAGSSALLRLSIGLDLTCDAGFYQLWVVLSDLRRMCRKHASALRRWQLFMRWYNGEPGHGPFHKLLHVLSQIGWTVDAAPQVIDHEGLHLDVLAIPAGLLRRRLEAAWLRYVALSHAHRPSMAGLPSIDPGLLRQDVAHLSPLDCARLSAFGFWGLLVRSCTFQI